MKVRVSKIEVCVRRETRTVVLLSPDGERSLWICHRQVEVLRATMVCDDDDDPVGVVCGRIVTPPVLQGANSVAAVADSSRPEEIAA